jgi:hypothetical protein
MKRCLPRKRCAPKPPCGEVMTLIITPCSPPPCGPVPL